MSSVDNTQQGRLALSSNIFHNNIKGISDITGSGSDIFLGDTVDTRLYQAIFGSNRSQYPYDSSSFTYNYGSLFAGSFSIKDPLFVNPAGFDFRLQIYSPYVTFDSNGNHTSTELDLAGNRRNVMGTDFGAQEFQYTSDANGILYVKKGSTGNGSSWTNAIGEVADALKWAKLSETQWTASNPLQIWVATGTYNPMYDPADNNFGNVPTAVNVRDVSFLLVNNVQLYGGFAGTETSLSARNWDANKTILSGDLGTLNDITDNAYPLVISFGKSGIEPISANTVMDGFTITGGNANSTSSRTISSHTINRQIGGGMFNRFASRTVTNVIISGNSANYGGGMFSFNSSPSHTNVILSGNKAIYNGGAMYNHESSPKLTNVTISGNTANSNGG